ncbi:MAG: hypothetical protein HFJ52_04145 [Clostridia bacterium]|jgi:hypothetical protein|nr:hypothetical protein [Clostridia bacterium]
MNNNNEIELSEEEIIFIKGLENKLNVSEYSEIRRIVNKYINIAEYNRRSNEGKEKIIESRDNELKRLYQTKHRQEEKYNDLEIKYKKAIAENIELEYKLDKYKELKARRNSKEEVKC